MIESVNKLGIPVIDIYQKVFIRYPDPLSLFPLRMFNHYSADGYSAVAQEIIAGIQRMLLDQLRPLTLNSKRYFFVGSFMLAALCRNVDRYRPTTYPHKDRCGFAQKNNCLFAGGTAIALRYGEYRESVDMGFFGL